MTRTAPTCRTSRCRAFRRRSARVSRTCNTGAHFSETAGGRGHESCPWHVCAVHGGARAGALRHGDPLQKIEGDQSTFHFPANLAWSIRAVGLQIVDILPKLYSRPTTLRQIGKDGAVSMTPVNQRTQNAQGEMEEHLLSQGSYDVAVDSGPAYSTQREMAAERLGELGRVLPQEMLPLISDLWVAQLDIPYAEEIAARLRTVVPPQALEATKDKNPQTAIAGLQNQLEQATQALQALQQQSQQAQEIADVSKQQVALLEQQVATMQARLADKQADNQLEAQKNQRDYEVEMRKLQLEEQKFLLEIQKAQQPQEEQLNFSR